MDDAAPTCALCGRPIPPGVPQSRHHLVPKLRGGKGGATVLLHQVCHKEIHATLSETELARLYNTPEALRAHPHLAKFVAWVSQASAVFQRPLHGQSAGAVTVSRSWP